MSNGYSVIDIMAIMAMMVMMVMMVMINTEDFQTYGFLKCLLNVLIQAANVIMY